ncbi:potassium channel family protein [Chryseolinea soli]|uniref:Two pore domain potassium channel family protein n=1 Tax=Chryseolinea soli TaxID=2321403 RepID=A0A385STU2_9BACT|nr:potassium channel family protein [Chryseolinea soli]AYB35263.1 two pore domain potassium channel family protein [Chryseolinea soli]
MNAIDNLWKNDKGFIWMLVIATITLISSQLSEGILWESKFIVRAGFFFVTLIAIRSSTLSKFGKLLGYAIAAAILLLAVVMIREERPALNLVYTILVAGYMIYIITMVIRQIFTSQITTVYQIGGGVAAYILLGHIWASMYLALYIIQPGSFQYGGAAIQNDEALKQLSYFSFVTLTTIGYGDITAVGPVARILVMIEGLLGQLFPAIFIATLVSHQIEDSRKK